MKRNRQKRERDNVKNLKKGWVEIEKESERVKEREREVETESKL